MTQEKRFDPRAILLALHRKAVLFVVIGGLAAVAHGSPLSTQDIDIMPELSLDNLARLSDALRDLDSRVRVEGIPDGLAFAHDARSLRAMTMLNLTTTYGPLDLVMRSANLDFDSVAPNAVEATIGGNPVRLASLDDIIRMKAGAGRLKDQVALPVLEALRERLGQRPTAKSWRGGA